MSEKKLEPIEVFDTPRAASRAMFSRLPSNTVRGREKVAEMETGREGLLVIPPEGYLPNEKNEDDIYLRSPGGTATVWLDMIRTPQPVNLTAEFSVQVVTAGVKVLFADDTGADSRRIGASPVDGGNLLIGLRSEMDRRWQVGGELNQTNLILDKHVGAAADPLKAALTAAGLRFEHTTDHADFIRFDGPLSEEQIVAVRKIVADASIDVRLNTWQLHSTELLNRQMSGKPYVVLAAEGKTFAVAFATGWGDGLYEWRQLRRAGEIVGYECDFNIDGRAGLDQEASAGGRWC